MVTTMAGAGGCRDNLMICVAASRLWWWWLMIIAAVAQSQNTTDPAEVRVINELFSQWGIPESSATQMGWNISGEPCSGTAVALIDFESTSFNPGLKCDCNFPNSTCHITQIKVVAMDAMGPIPEGLWNLTYLVNLNLNRNYLTGSLSPSIGKLTRMQWLTFGGNALSGEVPRELGLLTDLRSLAFDTNNFNGSLPLELGNLRRLQQLYIDSSGVSGEIPTTFANLRNLVTVRASDNELTGRIPDFIGNWSQLQSLRFEGNSFEGSIPASFSQLTSLEDLRISGLSNGTLDFIMDLKSLTVLSLRNNSISGSIPTDIGEYQNLTRLDLSFNNLSGQIPRELFNLSQISFLYLGNNSLTGTLPDVRSTTLLNIDLSYNELSGTLPSWVTEPNLQLNLVVNNFTLGGSGNSGLLSGLYCLQRNFPCYRGSPRYSNFGINCGGPERASSSSQIVYEQDNEGLGPATYYVTSERRWGVSNAGQRENPQYTASSPRLFTNTLDPQLFQTARISAGSLRYYGLGMENGNYTVTLQFAELVIEDGRTWRSHGRRVFDIYLQGKLVIPDFDIKRAAGGDSFSPISRQATVEVLDNFLEIHLLWSGKGSCCVPDLGTHGPLISAISATPNFIPTVSNSPLSTKKNRTGLLVGILVPIAVVSFLSLLALYIFHQRRKRQDTSDSFEEFLGIDARPNTFPYGELREATDEFSPANKLGEGGFGPVYKGTLSGGRVVAVKQLSVASHHGKSQFMAEIATISAVQHRNLVKLLGCCIEGEKRLLVYEYLENKSLDQALFGNNLFLTWFTRFEICLGIARGLAYLHEESRIRIVHRDVKASNVLLDSELNPKISDFGLAKLYDDKKTHMSTRVAGTIGYLAPEYAMRGHLTEKADVFGFGVVALEIISGRPNSDSSLEDEKIYLLEWAWNLHEADNELELVDEELSEFDEDEAKRVMRVALLCTQTSPMQRPSMSRVVAMLSGDKEAFEVITRPGYLTAFNFNDSTTLKDTLPTSATDSVPSASHSIVSPPSPKNASRPMLHDIFGEDR